MQFGTQQMCILFVIRSLKHIIDIFLIHGIWQLCPDRQMNKSLSYLLVNVPYHICYDTFPNYVVKYTLPSTAIVTKRTIIATKLT